MTEITDAKFLTDLLLMSQVGAELNLTFQQIRVTTPPFSVGGLNEN